MHSCPLQFKDAAHLWLSLHCAIAFALVRKWCGYACVKDVQSLRVSAPEIEGKINFACVAGRDLCSLFIDMSHYPQQRVTRSTEILGGLPVADASRRISRYCVLTDREKKGKSPLKPQSYSARTFAGPAAYRDLKRPKIIRPQNANPILGL